MALRLAAALDRCHRIHQLLAANSMSSSMVALERPFPMVARTVRHWKSQHFNSLVEYTRGEVMVTRRHVVGSEVLRPATQEDWIGDSATKR